jgi:hypothetical protein
MWPKIDTTFFTIKSCIKATNCPAPLELQAVSGVERANKHNWPPMLTLSAVCSWQ